jgi:hypothetical protein
VPAPRVEEADRERHGVVPAVVRGEHGDRLREQRRQRGVPRGADGAAGGVVLERAEADDARDEVGVEVGPRRRLERWRCGCVVVAEHDELV